MSGTAVDKAYDWLRTSILEGRLTTGSFVEEATVSEAAGVSRTPVREAMHRLAGEQIIQLVPRRGAQVREISAQEVLESYESRWIVESTAMRSVLSKAIDVAPAMQLHLDEMEALTSELVRGDSTAARIAYTAADKAFHRVYVSAFGNSVLLKFYDSLWPLHEWATLRRPNPSEYVLMVGNQHRTICQALASGDEELAIATLADHLQPFSQWTSGNEAATNSSKTKK